MKKVKEMASNLYFRGITEWNRFKNSERGDTNFVSMLLIIGIVVVLAGSFLMFGNEVMTAITTKVTTFIESLG